MVGEMGARRVSILAAVFAVVGLLGGVTAVTASAESLPEFGRCLPAETTKETKKNGTEKTVYHGKFSSKTCLRPSAKGTGKWEWYPGPGTANHFYGIGEEPVLETPAGEKIECSIAVFSGEYTGVKSLKGSIDFEGCNVSSSNQTCQSETALNGGTIDAKSEFTGELGQIGPGTREPVVGWLFKPSSGTTMYEFYCGAFPTVTEPFPSVESRWTVEGSVIGTLLRKAFYTGDLNKMSKVAVMKFAQSHGVQSPSSFEGGSPAQMSATIIDLKKVPPTTTTEDLGFETVAENGSGTGESRENPEVEEPSEVKTRP